MFCSEYCQAGQSRRKSARLAKYLLLFVFIAGDKAQFLQKVKTAREAQWKIRMLCMGILLIHGTPIEKEAEPDNRTTGHAGIVPIVAPFAYFAKGAHAPQA